MELHFERSHTATIVRTDHFGLGEGSSRLKTCETITPGPYFSIHICELKLVKPAEVS